MKKKQKKSIIVCVVLDVIAIFCLLLAYGPYSGFRNFIITTAMTTKDHKYLARFLYSEATINKVLSENYVIEADGQTNADDIDFDNQDTGNYANKYEEQILKRTPGNDTYKIIEYKEKDYHVYLVAVYDASKVKLMQTQYIWDRGENLSAMAKKNKAKVAINGGGFTDYEEIGNGGQPVGIVIKDGKIVNEHSINQGVIGINNDNVLVLNRWTAETAIKNGIRDAVEFGPFLIVNGKASTIKGNGGWGLAPRTVIAQRKDGIFLFLVVDGNGNKKGYRGGIDMKGLIDILQKYGAYNAANLDGGASSGLIIEGKIYNNPVAYSDSGERWLPNGFMVE